MQLTPKLFPFLAREILKKNISLKNNYTLMVTFVWYDIALCDEARHCLIIERANQGMCISMLRKYLMNRLTEVNNHLRKSSLPSLGKQVYKGFVRKLNSDINFLDEFF